MCGRQPGSESSLFSDTAYKLLPDDDDDDDSQLNSDKNNLLSDIESRQVSDVAEDVDLSCSLSTDVLGFDPLICSKLSLRSIGTALNTSSRFLCISW